MIEVFICEDDEQQRKKLMTYVENYIMIENLDMKVTLSTDNPEEIIDYLHTNDVKGLYFLDVNLNHEKTGIALGADIRKYDTEGSIVFVTSHSELTYLTFLYKVEAMDYIIKDDFTDIQKRVIDCINTAYERHTADPYETKEKFKITSGDKIISEDYDNIIFFETSSTLHKIVMHSVNRQVEFYGKLKDIEQLDDRFYRCHNSFIVNIDNIESIDNKTRDITMTNGAVCFASSRNFRKLKKMWDEK